MKLTVILLAFTPMLTACWDATDIRDIVAVVGIGIDMTDTGDIRLSVETPDPAGQAKQSQAQDSTQSKTRVVTATGKTLEDAFDDLSWRVPRKLMFSHNQILIFGQQYAKHSVQEALDFVARHEQLRTTDVMFILTDGNAKNLLTASTSIEYLSAHYLRELTISKSATFHTGVDLLNDFIAPSRTAVLPWIALSEDGSPKLQGVGILRDFQLQTLWREPTTRSLEWLTGPSQGEYLTLDGRNGSVSLRLISGVAKVHLESRQPLRFQIRAWGTAEIANMNDDKLPTEKVMKRLNGELDDRIERDLRDEVRLMREEQLDAAHFGTTLWRTDPDLWRKYKENWPAQLRKIPIDYDVHFHLLRSGFTGRDASKYAERDHQQER